MRIELAQLITTKHENWLSPHVAIGLHPNHFWKTCKGDDRKQTTSCSLVHVGILGETCFKPQLFWAGELLTFFFVLTLFFP